MIIEWNSLLCNIFAIISGFAIREEASIDFYNFYHKHRSKVSFCKTHMNSWSSSIYAELYVHLYIYRYRVSRVARWITTAGPTDLATALKSGLIYYYVLLLLFGYLYPYNIMPREIPRSRRYVTVLLPWDRDLIFRIGHNLGRSCCVEYYLSSQLFHGSPKISSYL